jgi:hypothetical protein
MDLLVDIWLCSLIMHATGLRALIIISVTFRRTCAQWPFQNIYVLSMYGMVHFDILAYHQRALLIVSYPAFIFCGTDNARECALITSMYYIQSACDMMINSAIF